MNTPVSSKIMRYAARKILVLKKLDSLDPILEHLTTLNLAVAVIEKRLATGVRSPEHSDEWIVRGTDNGIKRLQKIVRLKGRYEPIRDTLAYLVAVLAMCAYGGNNE